MPTHIALGDGLVLRSVQSQADADRYAAFNTEFVSAIQGLTCAKLLAHHPTMRWDDFFFVEDQAHRHDGFVHLPDSLALLSGHGRIASGNVGDGGDTPRLSPSRIGTQANRAFSQVCGRAGL